MSAPKRLLVAAPASDEQAAANEVTQPRRNKNDRVSVVALAPAQEAARDRVLTKIGSGEYLLEHVPCPDCGATGGATVAEKDRHGLPMRVVVCSRCGLLYTTPCLSKESLARYYESDAYELDRGAAPRDVLFAIERTKGKRITAFLDEARLADAVRGVVVEIGCGAGGILDVFRERGNQVLGCDLSPDCLTFGRARGLDVHYGTIDVAARLLAERGVRPDLLIYEQVLEHLPRPRDELETMRSVLPEDGLLYIGVPGYRNIDAHYASDLLHYLEIDHLVHYDLGSLRRIVCAAGFEFVRGDEQVRALFRCSDARSQPATHDRGDTLSFLRGLERRRRLKIAARAPRRVALRATEWLRLTWLGLLRRIGIR